MTPTLVQVLCHCQAQAKCHLQPEEGRVEACSQGYDLLWQLLP